MKKRTNYELGDVFLIPVKENIYGIGRVLIAKRPGLLVEVYSTVVKDKHININALKSTETLFKRICGDPGLSRGEWSIIGNIPLDKSESLPLFWAKDILTEKLYLRKYNASGNDPLGLGSGFTEHETTESEIEKENAQPDGLLNYKGLEMFLKYKLEQAGLI